MWQYSSDGELLASVAPDNRIRVYDAVSVGEASSGPLDVPTYMPALMRFASALRQGQGMCGSSLD